MDIRKIILSSIIFVGSLLVSNPVDAMEQSKKTKKRKIELIAGCMRKKGKVGDEKVSCGKRKAVDQPIQTKRIKSQEDKVGLSEQPQVAEPVQEVRQLALKPGEGLFDLAETKLLPVEQKQEVFVVDEFVADEKDSIFALPSDEVLRQIEKDLGVFIECWNFARHSAQNENINSMILSHDGNVNLAIYKFICPIVTYLCDSLKVQKCGIYIFCDSSIFHYYSACAQVKENRIILGKGFIENCLLNDMLEINKEEKFKFFIFVLAHEVAHLTEENRKEAVMYGQEFHADEVAATICSDIFLNFNSKTVLLLKKIVKNVYESIYRMREGELLNKYIYSDSKSSKVKKFLYCCGIRIFLPCSMVVNTITDSHPPIKVRAANVANTLTKLRQKKALQS